MGTTLIIDLDAARADLPEGAHLLIEPAAAGADLPADVALELDPDVVGDEDGMLIFDVDELREDLCPPALCHDCGTDTTPGACRRSSRACRGRWEYYTVHNDLWAAAGMAPLGGYLCVGCLESRLGRELNAADFTPNEPSPLDTPRLALRKTMEQ